MQIYEKKRERSPCHSNKKFGVCYIFHKKEKKIIQPKRAQLENAGKFATLMFFC